MRQPCFQGFPLIFFISSAPVLATRPYSPRRRRTPSTNEPAKRRRGQRMSDAVLCGLREATLRRSAVMRVQRGPLLAHGTTRLDVRDNTDRARTVGNNVHVVRDITKYNSKRWITRLVRR